MRRAALVVVIEQRQISRPAAAEKTFGRLLVTFWSVDTIGDWPVVGRPAADDDAVHRGWWW